MNSLREFAKAVEKQRPHIAVLRAARILVFDPGHTTGWCYFANDELIEYGQLATLNPDQATVEICKLLEKYKGQIDYVVFEEYRIYSWKTEQHAQSDVPTLRIIGTIETLCTLQGIRKFKQPAMVAKNFCTDAFLQRIGCYVVGQKHARDAIRHACYFLLFGRINK